MNIHQANQQTIRIMCQGLLQRVQKGVMPYFECGKCPAPWILRKSGWRSVFSEFPDTGLVVLAIGPAQQFFRAPDGQPAAFPDKPGGERGDFFIQNVLKQDPRACDGFSLG